MSEPATVPSPLVVPVPADPTARPHAAPGREPGIPRAFDDGAHPASWTALPRPGDRLLEGLLWALVAYERTRQRRQLRVLCEDRDLLRDVGLSREQALEEASRPFWRD